MFSTEHFQFFQSPKNYSRKISCSNLVRISDIYQMESITFTRPKTKQCPFCAETIQAQAIKCRFCGEFLNTNRARVVEAGSDANSQSDENGGKADNVLFAGRPSLFGMVGAVIRGLIFLGIAVFLVVYPLEGLPLFQPAEEPDLAAYETSAEVPLETETTAEVIEEQPRNFSKFVLTEEQALVFGKYRVIAGLGLGVLVVLLLLLKIIKLKMTHYEVTAERIEWSRGIFDRRVDNLDMFRVIDLRLRRSLLDCILGIGTVGLITTDKTDPEFTFEKIRNSRRLYDVIKKASLDADRRDRVIHLE